MKYMIVKYEDMKWQVIHYTHSFEDFERMCLKYPKEQGYDYMVSIGYVSEYELSLKIKQLRNKL